MATITQATNKPTAKVTAGGVGGAVAVLIAFVLSEVGVTLPAEAIAALTALLAFLASYIKKEEG